MSVGSDSLPDEWSDSLPDEWSDSLPDEWSAFPMKMANCIQNPWPGKTIELEFLNFLGPQELIPRNQFRHVARRACTKALFLLGY